VEVDTSLGEQDAQGDGPEEALVRAARRVSAAVCARVEQQARLAGEVPSCGAGCAACCTHLIPISLVEAAHLCNVVAKMPAPAQTRVRRRFKEVFERLQKTGLLAAQGLAIQVEPEAGESLWDTASRRYRALAIACPFLERGRCSIYEDRPLVCREYTVTSSPEACSKIDGNVRALPRPVRMSEVLADVVATVVAEGAPTSIPLSLAIPLEAFVRRELAKLPGDRAELARRLADALVVDESETLT
jgi:Fe-S-cluster containining protein